MKIIVETYVKNKMVAFLRKQIYKIEITEKAKTGIERLDLILDGIWEKLEKWILEERKRDLKWLPNLIEELGEDILIESIKILKTELDIKKLAQEIFNIEKLENPNIF